MSSSPRGRLFVVSAPSGTGKTTLVDRLVQVCPGVERSRSYTSRAPRAGEVDGVDYNFVSRPVFEAMVQGEAFLEWADVFGNLYGTGRQDTESRLAAGVDLVLVIDVQGARQVRGRVPGAVGVFVLPPSRGTLEQRLRARNLDGEAAVARRLETAASEVTAVSEYDYVVINDEFEAAVARLAAIVAAERTRPAAQADVIRTILETFGR